MLFRSSHSGFVMGIGNTVSVLNGKVLSGSNNTVDASGAVIIGGEDNTATGLNSVIVTGKGKTIMTGSLGDVMQESIQAAITVVRSRAQSLGLRTSFHENFDLHIHVPEGATPKDGPSAGVGMCTALVSALTAIPVRFDVAMTGEITLRGQVLKIGGLKEKLLAAHRGNIKTVIIPADNERDLIEIPDNIKADLEIVPVRWIDQVLEHALQYQPTPLSSDENQKQEKEAKQEDIDKIGDKKHKIGRASCRERV